MAQKFRQNRSIFHGYGDTSKFVFFHFWQSKSNPKQAIDLTIAHTKFCRYVKWFSLKCPETKEVHKIS